MKIAEANNQKFTFDSDLIFPTNNRVFLNRKCSFSTDGNTLAYLLLDIFPPYKLEKIATSFDKILEHFGLDIHDSAICLRFNEEIKDSKVYIYICTFEHSKYVTYLIPVEDDILPIEHYKGNIGNETQSIYLRREFDGYVWVEWYAYANKYAFSTKYINMNNVYQSYQENITNSQLFQAMYMRANHLL